MKYAIVCNPKAGGRSIAEKIRILNRASTVLKCDYHGLETRSAEEFRKVVKEIAKKCDVLVVAGGDGTLFDVINTVGPSKVLAYLPMGSGNAMKYALKLPFFMNQIIDTIKDGKVHDIDLIKFEGKKALFASLGLNAHIMKERHDYLEKKRDSLKGIKAYAIAIAKGMLNNKKRADAEIEIDGNIINIPNMLLLTITKIKNYGYGANVVPKAELNDGFIHILSSSHLKIEAIYGITKAMLVENKMGMHMRGKNVIVRTSKDQILSINGTPEKIGREFRFEILPSALKLIC